MRIIGNRGNTARKVQAVASGVLATGDTVVVNADGTVSVVSETTVTQAVGTAVTFRSALIVYVAAAHDSANNKVVIAYQDRGNSSYGTAVVGTVDPSDNSISFGTPVVFQAVEAQYMAITYDANAEKVLISYVGGSSYLTAIVGTVSGTGISFGTAVVVRSAVSTSVASVYDSDSQKVVVVATSTTPYACVGTISGTGISFGSRADYAANNDASNAITYDSNAQRVVACYRDGSDTKGKSVVGTVSGTTISFGSEVVFNDAEINEPGIAYDANAQKVVIAFTNGGNSNHGTAIVGTVSGTTISYGSSVVYNSSGVGQNNAVYDASAQRVVIAYQVGSTNGSAIAGKINGTSITFNTATVFQASQVENVGAAYDTTSERVVIPFRDRPSVTGDAVVFETGSVTPNLTAENYIGIASNGYATGQAATINAKGFIDDNQSSLTAGQSYFVQTNGDLGLTAADPSVFAGTAVSATKLIVKG